MEGNNNIIDTVIYVLHFSFICRTNRYNGNGILNFGINFYSISKEKWKYIYPIIISILFIPSVFIYYNSSALIHAVWYLVDSGIGFLIGLIIYKITNKE